MSAEERGRGLARWEWNKLVDCAAESHEVVVAENPREKDSAQPWMSCALLAINRRLFSGGREMIAAQPQQTPV